MKTTIVLLTFNLFVSTLHAQFGTYNRYTVRYRVRPKIIPVSRKTSTEPNLYHLDGNFLPEKGKMSLFMASEKANDKDNDSRENELPCGNSEIFAVDAIDCRFHGFGPIAKYTPKKSYFTMWLMPAYNPEHGEKRLIVGLSIKI